MKQFLILLPLLAITLVGCNPTPQNDQPMNNENNNLVPDLKDLEEARKAFIANEIFNRKY